MSQSGVQLISPQGNEEFNNGVVLISWTQADLEDAYTGDLVSGSYWGSSYWNPSYWSSFYFPYFDASFASNYEIEYTEHYREQDTVWSTLKRRIPYTTTSYEWNVGKSLKTNFARVRIRTRTFYNDASSDWSMSSGNFSINVFALLAPTIISPISGNKYNDYIWITLDDTLTANTYNQKVNYNLYYSSEKLDLNWTTIIENLPFGQNLVRWNISGLNPSDDYCLKLLVKNSSTCQEATEENPDQLTATYVCNINILSLGAVLIDTLPPQAVLQVENSLTKDTDQIINIFAEDNTSEVSTMQLRECPIDNIIKLGLPNTNTEPACKSITDILAGDVTDFSNIIGKNQGYLTKAPFSLVNKSGYRKIEGLLTDTGGNFTLEEIKTFLPVFDTNEIVTDFFVRSEINTLSGGTTETYDVAYVSTSSGKIWRLTPFSDLFCEISGQETSRIFNYLDIIYICAFDSALKIGRLYYYSSGVTLIHQFSSTNSRISSICIFDNKMYLGMDNGELWQYNFSAFSLLTTFSKGISVLNSDSEYLYIGFYNSEDIYIWNPTIGLVLI